MRNDQVDTKLIKDHIHGYIEIPTEYVKNIIDSSAFQRLRNIRQTSYDSLYPGASHNRFIHSLGVYYLGCKAYWSFRENCEKMSFCDIVTKERWNAFEVTFELACLLHDVGHMPFSHTGEELLWLNKEKDRFKVMKTNKGKIPVLYNDLFETMRTYLEEEEFKHFKSDMAKTIIGSMDYDNKKAAPKAHEIMSVVVALEVFGPYLREKGVIFDLFARAILGIQYEEDIYVDTGIKNALIRMLNSSTIDVDRLDYIMRDMQMCGFDSTIIDLDRLLTSIVLVKYNQKYYFGYHKNALSTIVNVVLAHDSERRWIQGHPVVMYDAFLLRKCLEIVDRRYRARNAGLSIYQKKALLEDGILMADGRKLRLMNDSDLLFLMKQIPRDDKDYFYVKEYLSRNERKQPLWKSEDEFQVILNGLTLRQQEIFKETFLASGESDKDSSIGSTGFLNEERVRELEAELHKIESDHQLKDEDKTSRKQMIEKQLFWLNNLWKYCEQQKIPFEICNNKTKAFISRINELSNQNIMIWYERFERAEKLEDALKTYKASDSGLKSQFYWYLKKPKGYSPKEFLEWLQRTLAEYEKKFGN